MGLKGLCQLASMRAEVMQITVSAVKFLMGDFLCHVQGRLRVVPFSFKDSGASETRARVKV